MIKGAFIAGFIAAFPCGYAAGRWHKSVQHWRHQAGKVRRDWRDVRRGPRW